ncbi:MAG: tetratricopeptide repeat protein [Litorimonas sp.]
MDATPTSSDPIGPATFRVGDWTVIPSTGALQRKDETRTLEPKVMDLLVHLSNHPDQLLSRAALDAALWPDMTVGDDVLSRTMSKLRKALGDTASAPTYIETLSKRGYRLIADVGPDPLPASRGSWRKILATSGLLLAAALGGWVLMLGPRSGPPAVTVSATPDASRLTQRADELYMRFTRADNEAAVALYNRAITADPDLVPARAGLANALVQRVVRWSTPPGSPPAATSMTEALRQGSMQAADQRATLERAARMAEQAVRSAPRDPDALKALGFTYAASGRTDEAIGIYETAVSIDPDAWTSWINLGEMQNLREPGSGLQSFQQAYEAMERRYAVEPEAIGPFLASMGLIVADTLHAQGRKTEATELYRRILGHSPFEPEVTARLARSLADGGDRAGGRLLCERLDARIGPTAGCDAVLKGTAGLPTTE